MTVKQLAELVGIGVTRGLKEAGYDPASQTIDLKSGGKLVTTGTSVLLRQGKISMTAPDGTYTAKDGKTVAVKQGRIVQNEVTPVAAADPVVQTEVAQQDYEGTLNGGETTIRVRDVDGAGVNYTVELVAADGTVTPAPAGSHLADDGTLIEVGEGGTLVSITAPGMEEVVAPAEQSADPVAAAAVAQAAALQKEVAKLKQQMEKLSKEPAARPPSTKPGGKGGDSNEFRQRVLLGQIDAKEAAEYGHFTRDELKRDFAKRQVVKEHIRKQFAQIGRYGRFEDRVKAVQSFVSTSAWDGQDWMKNIIYNLIQQGQMTNLDNRYVYLMDGVKGEMKVPTVSLTDSILQTHACEKTDSGNIDAADFTVSTCDLFSLVKFCITDFDRAWPVLWQTPGFNKSGADIFPMTLGDLLINLVSWKLSEEIEGTWLLGNTSAYAPGSYNKCDGLLTVLTSRGGYVPVDIEPITAANVNAQFAAMHLSIIGDTSLTAMGKENITWFVSNLTAGLYEQALASSSGDANFTLIGSKELNYLGYKIVPINKMPDNEILVTYTKGGPTGSSNLILATDLESDFAMMDVQPYPFPNNDNVGIKSQFRLGANVFQPEHVHYGTVLTP